MSTSDRRITKAAGVVGALTLISRVFGYARDMVIAAAFGAGWSTDVFIAAFRIPNIFRRMFGEGTLSIAFTTIFSRELTRGDPENAWHLAAAAFRFFFMALTCLSVVVAVLAPLIVRLLSPGFLESAHTYATAVMLTQWMAPYILFIGMVALAMGLLNALGHFAMPALAPTLLNLSMIAAVWFVCPHLSDRLPAVSGLAIGVVAGGLLQFALQIPVLVSKGGRFWRHRGFYHPALRQILGLMLPALFGSAVYQISILVVNLLASLLPQGSIACLYFADRLVQFPLGLFGFAIATAVMPEFSQQAAAGRHADLKETLRYAMRLVFFVSFPAMIGLMVLREPIITILFKRGAFDQHSVQLTSGALFYYAVGLWAFSAVRTVAAAFYALQDTATPVRIAVISIAANIILSLGLMVPMDIRGLALAVSMASILNFGLLTLALRRKLGPLGLASVWAAAARSLACSLMMGAAVWLTARYLLHSPEPTFIKILTSLLGSIAVGIAVYATLTFWINRSELRWLVYFGRGDGKE